VTWNVSVRKSYDEGEAHWFREETAEKENKERRYTATAIQCRRKQERVEHDLEHFGEKLYENPRFSDQQQPWWTLDPERSMERSVSAPANACKNNKDEYDECYKRTFPQTAPESLFAYTPEAPMTRDKRRTPVIGPAEKTTVRWSEDMLNNGRARQQTRLFDNIKPISTKKADHAPLEASSSFEFIRQRLYRDRVKAQHAYQRIKRGPVKFLESALPKPHAASNSVSDKTASKSIVSMSQAWQSCASRINSPPNTHQSKSVSNYSPRKQALSTVSGVGSKDRSSVSRQRVKTASSTCGGDSMKIFTVFRDAKSADLTMMDRTSQGFFAGVRSSGFQRLHA